jgi:hypothetical protein
MAEFARGMNRKIQRMLSQWDKEKTKLLSIQQFGVNISCVKVGSGIAHSQISAQAWHELSECCGTSDGNLRFRMYQKIDVHGRLPNGEN